MGISGLFPEPLSLEAYLRLFIGHERLYPSTLAVMFWLLRFRGETIWDTLALWLNAIVWQIHKLLYKLSHPSATKQDFVSYILSRKQHLH